VQQAVYVIAFVSPGQIYNQTEAFWSGCRPTREAVMVFAASRQIILKLKFLPLIRLCKNTCQP